MVETVLDIITGAMQDLGAIALEESCSAAEAAAGLRALTNLIETWNTERLMVYNIAPSTFAYVAGQQSYTLGSAANFNAARPVRIEAAKNRINAGAENQMDYDIYVTNDADEYASIVAKRIETVLPTIMYYDGGFPNQTCYFWPIPLDTTYAPVLWMWGLITAFAATSESISLPPGYKRAMQKNLAVEMGPAFGVPITPDLMRQAVESKAQIKRINFSPDTLSMPSGIPGAGGFYALPQFLEGR